MADGSHTLRVSHAALTTVISEPVTGCRRSAVCRHHSVAALAFEIHGDSCADPLAQLIAYPGLLEQPQELLL